MWTVSLYLNLFQHCNCHTTINQPPSLPRLSPLKSIKCFNRTLIRCFCPIAQKTQQIQEKWKKNPDYWLYINSRCDDAFFWHCWISWSSPKTQFTIFAGAAETQIGCLKLCVCVWVWVFVLLESLPTQFSYFIGELFFANCYRFSYCSCCFCCCFINPFNQINSHHAHFPLPSSALGVCYLCCVQAIVTHNDCTGRNSWGQTKSARCSNNSFNVNTKQSVFFFSHCMFLNISNFIVLNPSQMIYTYSEQPSQTESIHSQSVQFISVRFSLVQCNTI